LKTKKEKLMARKKEILSKLREQLNDKHQPSPKVSDKSHFEPNDYLQDLDNGLEGTKFLLSMTTLPEDGEGPFDSSGDENF